MASGAESESLEIKRKLKGDEGEEEEQDAWIGPLPTEAAPTKKRKGQLF